MPIKPTATRVILPYARTDDNGARGVIRYASL